MLATDYTVLLLWS